MDLALWLLTTEERGNPATELDRRRGPGAPAWSVGNRARPLVHGAPYFRRLHEVLCGLGPGDLVMFTDWRGDPTERLNGPGTEVAEVLADVARRKVQVKGLLWRSHTSLIRFSEEANRNLGSTVNEAGGEVLLDQRVRRFGSHHQKLFVVRAEGGDLAFIGGIDLCHGRGDDADHAGDPQALEMSPEYGPTPPWHDVQLELAGPVVGDLEAGFRERWDDPAPLDNRARQQAVKKVVDSDIEIDPDDLPPQRPDPEPAGTCAVQVLRTYPVRRPPYPFAPLGERSVAAAYAKVLARARRLVYLEDQYLWSEHVAEMFAEALTREPQLRIVAVVPRYPEQDGRLVRPPALIGRQEALDLVTAAGGDRVSVFDIENHAGTPIYVHAKVCVVDDVWASIGSDNLNLRSWTHDSELSCAVVDEDLDAREPRDPAGLGDGARRFARELRLELMREHLDTAVDDGLVDLHGAADEMLRRARALDAWYDGGRVGPRPAGRLRVHQSPQVTAAQKMWAKPLYDMFVDPDGRPRQGLKRRW